jgi:hypothetical protein
MTQHTLFSRSTTALQWRRTVKTLKNGQGADTACFVGCCCDCKLFIPASTIIYPFYNEIAPTAHCTIQILIHLLLSSFHPRYSEATRITSLTSSSTSWFWFGGQKLVYPPYGKGQTRKANATFIVLARNADVDGVVKSVEEIDRRFNAEAGYPYTFLNDEAFTNEFIECVSYHLIS